MQTINDLVLTSLSLFHGGSVALSFIKPDMFYRDTNASALKNKIKKSAFTAAIKCKVPGDYSTFHNWDLQFYILEVR